jgi:hypothetical protein
MDDKTKVRMDLDEIAHRAFCDKIENGEMGYKFGGPDCDTDEAWGEDLFVEAPDGTVYQVEIDALLITVCQECFTMMGKHKMDCSKR